MKIFLTFLLLLSGLIYAQTYDTTQVVAGWNLIGALQTGPL